MNEEKRNEKDPYYPKKVLFVSCEECGFAVIFIHDNRHFFYCKKDRAGANLADSQKVSLCSICKQPAERYDLAEEDNFCPICQHGYLSVMYGDKQFSKEEANALYKKAQQAEENR